jgi:hypothetical protein
MAFPVTPRCPSPCRPSAGRTASGGLCPSFQGAPSPQIIERGKAAGVVPDCETQDVGVLQTMVGAVMDASAEVEPDLWPRYFTIALQGLRPAGAPLAPLPVPPLPPEQMEDLLAGQWKPRKG